MNSQKQFKMVPGLRLFTPDYLVCRRKKMRSHNRLEDVNNSESIAFGDPVVWL